jgi:hypothetical protein
LVGMDILQEPAAFIFRAERNGIIILTLWLPSHAIELLARNAKAAWEQMQLYWDPQYFHKWPSNDRRYRHCEGLLFPLNIGMSHLMPCLLREMLYWLIFNEVIFLAWRF